MSVLAPGTRCRASSSPPKTGALHRAGSEGPADRAGFYPFAFSPVCTDQLQLYEAALGELAERGVTKLYGVSCDSSWAQKAFREKLGVSIEQLSDFEPKGAACEAFGVLHEGGFPERALVAIDADAPVRWSYQAPSPGELPSVELLREGVAIAFDGAVNA